MELSITKIVIVGSVTLAISRISSNNASSCLCLPDVSTMIRSDFSSSNRFTPAAAIVAGSLSV